MRKSENYDELLAVASVLAAQDADIENAVTRAHDVIQKCQRGAPQQFEQWLGDGESAAIEFGNKDREEDRRETAYTRYSVTAADGTVLFEGETLNMHNERLAQAILRDWLYERLDGETAPEAPSGEDEDASDPGF